MHFSSLESILFHLQFLQDLFDNKAPANRWQDYRAFCDNIKNIDINLYIKALPELLKNLKSNYPTRNLLVALERKSKADASFGKEMYSKTLETNNPDSYFTLMDILSCSNVIISSVVSIKKRFRVN